MARVSYNQLPAEGPKEARDVSRIVNQAMQGNQNCVVDINIPAGGLDTGTFTYKDPRISAQKYIDLIPVDAAGLLLDDSLFIAGLAAGEMTLGTFPQELQQAYVQVGAEAATGPSLITPARIPFDVVDFEANFTADNVNDLITSLVTGLVEVNFSLSGAYATGTTYEFGVNIVSGPNVGASFSVFTSTSNQNDVISVTGSVLAELAVDDVMEFFGSASKAGTLDPYNLNWSIKTVSGSRGFIVEPGDGPWNFRALIIG